MIKDIYKYEEELNLKGYRFICGCDEAGRGPMAGPLVASGVILPIGYKLDYLDDSKKLTPKKRDQLFDIIKKDAIAYEIESISVEDVDKYNVYDASKIAMTRCVEKLKQTDYVLTDCMPLDIDLPVLSLIKGDSKSASIAAASILAKVTRDRYMEKLDEEYPQYNWAKNAGYLTKEHLNAIDKYGLCKYHRPSFLRKHFEKQKQLSLF